MRRSSSAPSTRRPRQADANALRSPGPHPEVEQRDARAQRLAAVARELEMAGRSGALDACA